MKIGKGRESQIEKVWGKIGSHEREGRIPKREMKGIRGSPKKGRFGKEGIPKWKIIKNNAFSVLA